MIRLYFSASDGWHGRYQYKSLASAQRGAQRRLGESPEVGTGYAVSPDGIVTMRASGATFSELFPKIAHEQEYLQQEAEQYEEERKQREEYDKNYRSCEHGMDASLCGGPMHWYDNPDEMRPF